MARRAARRSVDAASERRSDGKSYLDAVNEEILERLERSGEAYVSKAIVGGRVHLRACIVNFRTEVADVEALPGIVARHGRQIHEEWGGTRPAAPVG